MSICSPEEFENIEQPDTKAETKPETEPKTKPETSPETKPAANTNAASTLLTYHAYKLKRLNELERLALEIENDARNIANDVIEEHLTVLLQENISLPLDFQLGSLDEAWLQGYADVFPKGVVTWQRNPSNRDAPPTFDIRTKLSDMLDPYAIDDDSRSKLVHGQACIYLEKDLHEKGWSWKVTDDHYWSLNTV